MTKAKPQTKAAENGRFSWVTKIGSPLGVILGFVGGFLVSDIVSYREGARASLGAGISEYKSSSKELDSILITFAEIASGDVPLKDENVTALRKGLLSFRQDAENLTTRVPKIAKNYVPLENSILTLIENATKISTPDKNKEFVETVAQFKAASNEFEQAAIQAQQKYF
jgi:hypothetical protein